MKQTRQIQSVTAQRGRKNPVCRMLLTRKRLELTQRMGIRPWKQAVVFKRREGSKTAEWDVGVGKGYVFDGDLFLRTRRWQSSRQGDSNKALICQEN